MSATITTQVVHDDTHAVDMVISPAGSISSTLKSDHASSFHEEIQDPQKPQQQQQPTAPAPLTRWAKIRKISWELFVKYWFLIGLGFVIGLAFAIPWVGKSYGSIQAQYTVKWGAVIVIFFLSGLGLDVMVMLKTILRWRLHLYVQFVSFIILPFLAWGIVRFFIAVGANLDNMVYQGWIIALSTSTTVSSNSVMTRNANGNDSAAVFNAALGNVLGIFISPALMTVFGDDRIMFPPGSARGTPDYTKILFQLGLSVLVPLVVGQVIRFFFPAPIKKLSQKLKFPIINSVALLIMVWSVFCDGVASDAFHRLSGADIVAIIGVDIFLYIFGCALCLFICRLPWWGLDRFGWEEPAWLDKYRMSRKDAAAVMYCGATKTVSMGIPLISVLYADTSYGVVGVLSLPLLLYHICQLFIGNFQVSWLKKWIENGEEQDRQKASIQQEKIDAPETESLPSFNTRRRTNGERTSSE